MAEIEKLEDEIALVKEIFDDEVLVQIERKGACKSCSLNILCMGGENKAEFRIKSSLPLKPGDKVKLDIRPESRLFSSFLIFIFPILMMVFFFVISRYLIGFGENLSIFLSLAGLLFSGIIIKYADSRCAGRIHVEIAEKVEV